MFKSAIPFDRRDLFMRVAAAAAPLGWSRGVQGQPHWQDDPFSLGVASGSPTHEGVVLWTRLMGSARAGGALPADRPVSVRWEVSSDEAFRHIVKSGWSEAPAELGHSVHVEVSGLAADRWYFYRFMAGDAVSPTGRTRTFPAPDVLTARLRLAYASCQRWEHGYFSAWRHLRDENPDVVMFLGDYIYEYPGAVNAVRMPIGGWVRTLEDYRQRYALYRGEPELQAMHAACPWLVTWDDHEVQNDYAGLWPGNSGAPEPDFAARRAAAFQAFYEHMPVRAAVLTRAVAGLAQGAEMRIYGKVPFGRLATLYWLDGRQYRDVQACTPGGRAGSGQVEPARCEVWEDPRRSLLGRAQEQWLDRAFAQDGGAVWHVLGQQTLFGRRNFRSGPDRRLWNDGWDGYGPARNRFIASVQRHHLSNPVLLGGDVHENWVGHVKADYDRPESAPIGVEFCGTSITSRASSLGHFTRQLAENPHFVFADNQRHGYGLADFTPRHMTTTLRVVDDVTRRDAQAATLARFVVMAGRPVIETDRVDAGHAG